MTKKRTTQEMIDFWQGKIKKEESNIEKCKERIEQYKKNYEKAMNKIEVKKRIVELKAEYQEKIKLLKEDRINGGIG